MTELEIILRKFMSNNFAIQDKYFLIPNSHNEFGRAYEISIQQTIEEIDKYYKREIMS